MIFILFFINSTDIWHGVVVVHARCVNTSMNVLCVLVEQQGESHNILLAKWYFYYSMLGYQQYWRALLE